MCGIAGWIASRKWNLPPYSIDRMTAAIAHRGPDGSGSFTHHTCDSQYEVVLGHRRLAIIDPAGGQQPMSDHDGRLVVVYNGEIYNFRELRRELTDLGVRFKTSCDTEVLLYCYKYWGTDCVSRLRGMFAFAIWDAEHESLFLARDRFGKKPLFLYQREGIIVFASEIKAILELPLVERTLDQASVVNYLLYRYVPGPNTLFANIHKLPPGTWAIWKSGTLERCSYYTPPDGTRIADRDQPANPVAEFSAKLDEAVRLRLVSDVPFGVFLSGGLDSSTIAALMQRHLDAPVKSFSIGFTEERFNEAIFAKQVADHLGTDHLEVRVGAREVIDLLPKLVRLSDAPVSEPGSVMFYLLAQAASQHVKMVLTGEGADEVLAGYPKHLFEPYSDLYSKLIPNVLHQSIIQPLLFSLPYDYRRIKTLVANLGVREFRERMPSWFGALTREQLRRFTMLPSLDALDDDRPFSVRDGQSALRRICYFDQTSVLPDNLLERGDRMTMGASIEARMPFMDHELVELVASLSDRVRIRGTVQKWILRHTAAQFLPPEIVNRRKLGFSTPIRMWMRDQMRDFIYDYLTDPGSMTGQLYRKAALNAALREHFSGRHDHEKLLWMLLNLELFQRAYRLS